MNEQIAEIAKRLEDQQIAEQIAAYEQEALNKRVLDILQEASIVLRNAKPIERNELARRYAITITEMEKVLAYFQVYVVGDD